MTCSSTKGLRLDSSKPFKRIDSKSDPVMDHVRAWIAAKDAQDAMILDWQDAEHRLSLRIKPLKIGLDQAGRSDLQEAKTMRYLMRRIRAADRALGRSAEQITLMQSTTPMGALAKIEMALRIHQPANLEAQAWALMDSGARQLRRLLVEG